MRITVVEFDRMTALFRQLGGDDWTRPTDNDQWDVRATALHLLGAAEANASLRESVRQFTRGKRLFKQIGGNHWVDGINEIQIRDRAGVANDQIADRYAAAAPGAVKVRRRIPGPVRKLRVIDMGPPIGKETVGYLMDMVYTRDVWMHRVDIAARGRQEDRTHHRARRPHRRRHGRRMGHLLRRAVRPRARRRRRRHVSPRHAMPA